jgi:hypothetical protein
MKQTIIENKNSIAIKTINENLDKLKLNFVPTTDSSLNSDAILNQFFEFIAFTDYSEKVSYQKGCSSNTKDYWVPDNTTCPSSYTYIKGGESNIGSPSCLVLSEWTSAQVNTRYASAPSGCGPTGSSDFTTVSSAASSYFNSMNAYSSDNGKLIDEIKTEHVKINSSFTRMADLLLDLITKLDGILTPLVAIFNKFVGESPLFALINCCKNTF